MNRMMRRASETNGRRLQRREWNVFQDITDESRERNRLLNGPKNFRPNAVYMNNRYVVQCFFNRSIIGKPATKVMVRRCDSEPIYSWPDLQRIKNEIFGAEAEAIQMFPKQSELVDDANLYWLWVLENPAGQEGV